MSHVEQDYRTPTSTTEAYTFGRRGAMYGRKHMTRRQFLSRQDEPHPFPSSLWRAYQLGHRDGLALAARVAGASSGGASG